MPSLPQWLNPVWLGPTLGIIGIACAVVFFILNRRARIGPRFVYHQHAVGLIGDSGHPLPNEIELLYRGRKVPRVSKTQIVIWNSGTAPISESDIMEAIQFAFRNDVQILNADIVMRTRDANAVEAIVIPDAPNLVKLFFRYLDPGDGAAFEILHTGDKQVSTVRGTIRGIPQGPRDFGGLSSVLETFGGVRRARIAILVIVMLAALSLVLRTFGLEGPQPAWVERMRSPLWFDLVIGSLVIPGGLWVWWNSRRRYPVKLREAIR